MSKHVPALMAALLLAATAQAGNKDAPPSGDDVVCTYEKVTGSHLRKKVCMTRSAREERARDDRDAMQRLRGSGVSASKDPRP